MIPCQGHSEQNNKHLKMKGEIKCKLHIERSSFLGKLLCFFFVVVDCLLILRCRFVNQLDTLGAILIDSNF